MSRGFGYFLAVHRERCFDAIRVVIERHGGEVERWYESMAIGARRV